MYTCLYHSTSLRAKGSLILTVMPDEPSIKYLYSTFSARGRSEKGIFPKYENGNDTEYKIHKQALKHLLSPVSFSLIITSCG